MVLMLVPELLLEPELERVPNATEPAGLRVLGATWPNYVATHTHTHKRRGQGPTASVVKQKDIDKSGGEKQRGETNISSKATF